MQIRSFKKYPDRVFDHSNERATKKKKKKEIPRVKYARNIVYFLRSHLARKNLENLNKYWSFQQLDRS